MRGRKTDSDFVSNFISESVRLGHDTPEKIVERARKEILGIDEEIKRVEQKKIARAKILDVIATLDRDVKASKSEEARILSFFKIQNPSVCKFICSHVNTGVTAIEDLSQKHAVSDIMFCIKQLLEHKIVAKSGAYLLRGETFDDYLKFVLRES
jgi:hypothetical protein